MTLRTTLGKHVAPWRFVLFFIVMIAASIAATSRLPVTKAALVGFDIAAIVFLASCYSLFDDEAGDMRRVAKEADANRVVLLVLTFVLTVVILAAIVSELGKSGKIEPWEKGLIAASLALVWLFANAVYTLHYCHLFYTRDDGGKDCAGLDFPGTKEPLMSDFMYFAYTLGVAVQTSDVDVTSCHIRKVVTAHCVVGFFFNLGVLALTINVLGSN